MLLQLPKFKHSHKPEPFLRWLFVATFTDGHVIQQTQEDKCFSRDDGTGSAFTDVIEYTQGHLIGFSLFHINGKESVQVDLKSGNFMVNGTPFSVHNQYFDPSKYDLKLVYFRETRVDQDITSTVQDDMSVNQEQTGDPRHYVNRYFVGWETVVNGQNKQVTIAVG